MAAQIGSLFVSLTADVKPFAADMARAAQVTRSTAASIDKSVTASEKSIGRLRGAMNHRNTFSPGRILAASRAFDSLNSRTDLLRAALLTTTAAFGGLAAAMTSNVLLRYADTAAKLSNQLRVVSKDSGDLIAQQRAIAESANNARSSLSASATLYARIRKSVPERSAEKVLRYTATVQKALQLGGASAQEAASAMLQLSQGIASNRLGGEELRAVLETPLGLELAKGLGVTIARFREMGHAGELTADVVLNALERIGPSIDKQFSQSVRTLDQALTVADNNITLYIGSVNEAYGITTKLGDGIVWLSEHLEELGAIAAAVGITLGAAFASRLAVRGMSASVGGAISVWKNMREQSAASLKAAGEDLEKLKGQLRDLEAERANASLKTLFPQGQAPMAEMNDYRRAIEEVRKAEDQLAKATADHNNMAVQAFQSQAQMSTKALSLAEKQIAAERRLIIEKSRLRDINARLESVQASRPRILDSADYSYDEKKARMQRSDDLVKSLSSQSGRLQGSIKATENEIAVAAGRIAKLQVEADRKAAEDRVKIARDIADKQIEIENRKAAIIAARSRADVARATVESTGVIAVSNELATLQEQHRKLTSAVTESEAAFTKFNTAANLAARGSRFLVGGLTSLVALFGGGWGVALTGAIVGLGYYAAKQAEAEQASERFNQRLREMGLLADEATQKLKSLAEQQAAAAQEQADKAVEEVAADLERLQDFVNSVSRGGFTGAMSTPAENRALANLVAGFLEGSMAVEEFNASVARMLGEGYGSDFTTLAKHIQQVVNEFAAGSKAVPILAREAKNIRDVVGEGPLIQSPGASIAAARKTIAEQARFMGDYRQEMARTAEQQRIYTEAEKIMKNAGDASIKMRMNQALALAEEGIRLREAADEYARITEAINDATKAVNDYNTALALQDPFDPAAQASRDKADLDRQMRGAIRGLADEKVGEVFINPFKRDAELAYLQKRREELGKSAEAQRFAALVEQELAAAREAGIEMLPKEAEELAKMQIAAEIAAAAAERLATANDAISASIQNMIGMSADYERAVSILPNFLSGAEDEARKQWEIQRRMDAALKDQQKAFGSLSSDALSNPFAAGEMQAELDKILADSGRSADELQIEADAQELYNRLLADGRPITMALATETVRLAAARRKAREEADAERKSKSNNLPDGTEPGVPKPDPRKSLDLLPAEELILSAERHVQALQMEQVALGMTKVEGEALMRAYELLNQARDAGITLTEEEKARLIELGAQMAVLADKNDQVAQAMEGIGGKDLVKGFVNDLRAGKSAAEALLNVLNKLADKLLDMAIDGVWDAFTQQGGAQSASAIAQRIAPAVSGNASATAGAGAAASGGWAAKAGEWISGVLGVPTAKPSGAVGAAIPNVGTGRFNIARGNPNIDPRLMDILRTTAERGGWKADFISGKDHRPGNRGYHPKGMAADLQLYDAAGNPLKNYQNAKDFRQYEMFAQQAREVQMEKYPELADRFRFGGYFSGPKGKYGALDSMHFDLGPTNAMAGGSWAGGLTQRQRSLFPGVTSYGMGQGPVGNLPLPVPAPANDAAAALNNLADSAKTADSGLGDLGTTLTQTLAPATNGMGTGPVGGCYCGGAGAPGAAGAGGGPMDLSQFTNTASSGIGGLFSSLGSVITNLFSGLFKGFGGIFQGILSIFGFKDGGAVDATGGGRIAGPGGPRSDSIPAYLSDGEFVVNAVATRRFGHLLQAMNDNQVPRFAAGGLVGDGMPSWRDPTASLQSRRALGDLDGRRVREAPSGVKIQMNNYGAQVDQKVDTDGEGNQRLTIDIDKEKKKIKKDMKQTFGLRERKKRA